MSEQHESKQDCAAEPGSIPAASTRQLALDYDASACNDNGKSSFAQAPPNADSGQGADKGAGRALPDFYPALAARIRSRLVADPDHPGCLVFPQKPGRHPRMKYEGKMYSPHRVIAEYLAGRLLEPGRGREDACHSCDNPPCCNPDHLFVGSRLDNIMDAVSKGRVGQLSPAALLKLTTLAAERERCPACNRWVKSDGACAPCERGDAPPGLLTRLRPRDSVVRVGEAGELDGNRMADRARVRVWLEQRRPLPARARGGG
jgi:hypothetical protein